MNDLSGLTIKGYQLIEQTGVGGFGTIYRAVDTNVLKRPVAVKVIMEKYANDPHFIRRFESEAQIIANLEHPHIIPLYDFWREPNNAYIVLRWMPGGTLLNRIENGPLPLDEVTHILDQLLSALSFAHKKRIIHRDISPNNILFDSEDNAVLTDFGISTSVDARESWTGKIMGSVNYLAPEQTTQDALSAATDLFAFGIVLFEMLTGKHPFEHRLLAQIRLDIPSIKEFSPDLPASLEQVIQKAAAKNQQERFQSAQEFLLAYRRALSGTQYLVKTTITKTKRDIPNPYKGIEAFQQGDAAQFYGRKLLIERLINHLAKDTLEGRFLAVVGASGSGKSSLVKAGLIL